MQTDLDLESRSRSTAHDRNHRMFLSFISNQGLSAAMQAACSNISGNALMQISVVVVVKLCLYLALALCLMVLPSTLSMTTATMQLFFSERDLVIGLGTELW